MVDRLARPLLLFRVVSRPRRRNWPPQLKRQAVRSLEALCGSCGDALHRAPKITLTAQVEDERKLADYICEFDAPGGIRTPAHTDSKSAALSTELQALGISIQQELPYVKCSSKYPRSHRVAKRPSTTSPPSPSTLPSYLVPSHLVPRPSHRPTITLWHAKHVESGD